MISFTLVPPQTFILRACWSSTVYDRAGPNPELASQITHSFPFLELINAPPPRPPPQSNGLHYFTVALPPLPKLSRPNPKSP